MPGTTLGFSSSPRHAPLPVPPAHSQLLPRGSTPIQTCTSPLNQTPEHHHHHHQPDHAYSIGAVHRSRFSLWDLSKLQGGKPALSGPSFPEGAHRFRWCPTYPEYFAISTRNAGVRSATIHVHSAMHAHAHVEPTAFTLAPRPLCVRDFDFVPLKGIPRIAAAVGHEIIVFPIGVE
jgi:hypothetical protein